MFFTAEKMQMYKIVLSRAHEGKTLVDEIIQKNLEKEHKQFEAVIIANFNLDFSRLDAKNV